MQTDAQEPAPPWLARAGGTLFRYRSFTPLPLLAALLPLLVRSRGAPHAPAWEPLGFFACLLGQALRTWVIGQVPDGTSGQNEALIATQLNAGGPYAHTRNPLYLGNFLITLGLCLVAHDPLLLAVVAAAFGLQYRAIIAAEERFLGRRFGAVYDEFRARVPRFWPRLWPVRVPGAAPPRAFSPRRALRKEHNPLAAWVCIALVLLALDRAAPVLRARRAGTGSGPLWPSLAPFAVALALVLALWLGVKAWKHRWLSGGFAEDLRRRMRETAR